MNYKLLLIFLVMSLSSCATYVDVHNSFKLSDNCIFEKFTEEEKDLMTNEIGSKIARNQNSCVIMHDKIKSDVKAHNAAHKN